MNASRSCLLPLLLLSLAACGPGLPGEPAAQGNNTGSNPPAQAQRPVVEGVFPAVFPVGSFSGEAARYVDVFVRGPNTQLSFSLDGFDLSRAYTDRVGVVPVLIPDALLAKAGTLKLMVSGAENGGPWSLEVRDGPPEGGPQYDLDGSSEAFIPDYHPQEILEMAQKLYNKAKG